ncbi:MAG: hypothetical protein C0404_04390, partial [Verrucomicrobia bacterium]|nr:hypothetical protein [Verrucomicrobiota bacterium]
MMINRLYVACLLLMVASGALRADPSAGTNFYFVQITDTHWGSREGLEVTKRVVELVNNLPFKVEFVAHTGDITADQISNTNIVSEGLRSMS